MDPFSDIAAAADSGDRFESFTKQFLEASGLTIIRVASRGPDGGCDLIVGERFTTVLGTQIDYQWLVSCKFRSDGRAINPQDEQMIIDRLQRYKCNGFIGFYTSVPSTNLIDQIEALKNTSVAQIHMFDVTIFTGNDIASRLNSDVTRFGPIMQTFMPTYYAQLPSEQEQQTDRFTIEEEDNHEQ